ncbi:MAG: hypothetical protein WDM96_06715 [Lacunisphaera sp.]
MKTSAAAGRLKRERLAREGAAPRIAIGEDRPAVSEGHGRDVVGLRGLADELVERRLESGR